MTHHYHELMNKYEIIIYWNDTDKVYVTEIPELKGCVAHEDSHDEVLKEINFVAQKWLETAKENGWLIPEPKGKLMYA